VQPSPEGLGIKCDDDPARPGLPWERRKRALLSSQPMHGIVRSNFFCL
jgi:hypothetical protein